MSEPVRHYRESLAQPPGDYLVDPVASLRDLLTMDLAAIECVDHGIDVLQQVSRMKALVESIELGVRARVQELGQSVMPDTVLHAEVGLALRVGAPGAGRVLSEAEVIVHDLTPVHAALSAGAISMQHARRMMHVLRPLVAEKATTPDGLTGAAVARQLAEQIMPFAATHTPGETESRLRSWLIKVDPRSAEQRQEDALRTCNVRHDVLDDGIGLLSITGPIEQTTKVYSTLTATARADAAGSEEELTIGQRRAALALGVLLEAATPTDGMPEGLDVPDDLATTLLQPEEVAEWMPGWTRGEAQIIYAGAYASIADRFLLDVREWVDDYDPEHDPEPPSRRLSCGPIASRPTHFQVVDEAGRSLASSAGPAPLPTSA